MSSPEIHSFCISHKQPLLPESWYDECIALGDFQPDSQFHVRRLDPFWHEARPIAYGAAGSLVLPIALARLPESTRLIEITSYRKRILAFPHGRESTSYPTMRELGTEAAAVNPRLAPPTPRNESGFLIAQPIYFESSVFRQYAAAHHRRDIIDYVSLARKMGVLDKKSAKELFAEKEFIPGGVELGIYPRPWLAGALSKLEVVSREFLYRHGRRVSHYDKYQIRAVGFLSERLGSFLLLRHLRAEFSGNIPGDVFGHMTTIVEDGAIYDPGNAD
jgi:hypothetical protein